MRPDDSLAISEMKNSPSPAFCSFHWPLLIEPTVIQLSANNSAQPIAAVL